MNSTAENQEQKTDAENGRHGGGFGRAGWMFVGLVVLYLGAIGPLAKFYGGTPPETVSFIYKPVTVFAERSAAVDRIVGWYVHDIWGANYNRWRSHS